ncbi:MAG: hypothetical protein IT232_05005 [Flavobacteriales bacterium]|nr:hypothetical protein [Flavobacteriales bacterium]
MKKNKIFCTLFILLNLNSFAQHFIGANVGYFEYSGKYDNKCKIIGLRYQIENPCDTCEKLNVWMASRYEILYDKNKMSNYLRTGLGFDLHIGRKLFYVNGGGLAGKLLVKDSNYNDYEFKKIVFSSNINTGVGYKFSNLFFVTFLAQYYIDISPTYLERIPNKLVGNSGTENVFGKYYFFQINLNYLIKYKLL